MKFNKDDIQALRTALAACRVAGLDTVVFSEGQVRGLGEKKNSAILSPCVFSFDKDISLGISGIGDLLKRIDLFGDLSIEGELNDVKKVRKLVIRGEKAKIEFRCTDEKLITYPKSNNGDEPHCAFAIEKHEVDLISKAAKTLGAETLVLQITRDGLVKIECMSKSMDRFDTVLSNEVVFHHEQSAVQQFDVSSNGVFLSLLESAVKNHPSAVLTLQVSGNMIVSVMTHDIIAIPSIPSGE